MVMFEKTRSRALTSLLEVIDISPTFAQDNSLSLANKKRSQGLYKIVETSLRKICTYCVHMFPVGYHTSLCFEFILIIIRCKKGPYRRIMFVISKQKYWESTKIKKNFSIIYLKTFLNNQNVQILVIICKRHNRLSVNFCSLLHLDIPQYYYH